MPAALASKKATTAADPVASDPVKSAGRLWRVVLCVGLVGLAAACAGAPAADTPGPVAVANPPSDAAPSQNQAAQPTTAPEIAAAPAAVGARALVGLGREALVARLGPANFVRRDGPAEVWRYRTAECYFEAFLYRDNVLGQRVAHVDARTLQGRPMPVDACFAQIANPARS
jgi:hypothetical protein